MKNAIKKVEEFEKGRFEEEIQRIRMKKEKEMRLNPEAKSSRKGNCQGDIQQSCYMDGTKRNLMKNT